MVHTPYCCALNWRGTTRTEAYDSALRSICHRGSACRCPIHGYLQALTLGTFFKCHRCRCLIRTELECSGFEIDLRWHNRFRLTASYLSCLAKKGNPKKATPTVPVAARLPCDARSLRRLRNSHPQSSDCGCSDSARRLPLRALRFSAGPTGARRGHEPKHSWLSYLERTRSIAAASVGSPLGPPRSAGGTGVVRRGCLSEAGRLAGFTSSAAARSGEHRRVVVRSTTGTSGVAFFWLLFLAKQEK